MNKTHLKRYLVSYTERDISIENIVQIFETTIDCIKDAVQVLSGTQIANENDILHFPELSLSCIYLDEKGLQTLQNNEHIASIEEDIPVYIAEEGNLCEDNPQAAAYLQLLLQQAFEKGKTDGFTQGFQKGWEEGKTQVLQVIKETQLLQQAQPTNINENAAPQNETTLHVSASPISEQENDSQAGEEAEARIENTQEEEDNIISEGENAVYNDINLNLTEENTDNSIDSTILGEENTLSLEENTTVKDIDSNETFENVNVESENASVISENVNVETENASVISEDANVESENASVISENANVESENASVISENANVESENASVISEDANVESENASVISENANVESENATLVMDEANVESENAALVMYEANIENDHAALVMDETNIENENSNEEYIEAKTVDNEFVEESSIEETKENIAVINPEENPLHQSSSIHESTEIPLPLNWNIQMTNASKAWEKTRGEGVKVAVLDTGIASHENLSILKGISFVQGVDSYEDKLGHGTHCAGIIAAKNNHIGMIGIAPAVELLAVKVLGDSGKGTFAWVIAGLCWALREGANVVSMSLGTMHAPLQAYKIAVEKLNNNNISVVCAAGNSFGTNEYRFVNAPANTTGVIAVGAVDANGQIAHFSSQGSEGNPITIVAPGVEISSTFLGNQYRTYSGTSMACPHVAAAVALLKSLHPELIPAEIKSRLMSTAQSLGETETYGAGVLDCAAFVG